MSAAISVPVKAALVNWLPWSVLKISGLPKRANAFSSADTQNDTSIGIRQPPRQHRPARPVDDGDEVEKPSPDRDVGDVGGPDLVRPVDRQIAQEIREDLVVRAPALSSAASAPAPRSPSSASTVARACG